MRSYATWMCVFMVFGMTTGSAQRRTSDVVMSDVTPQSLATMQSSERPRTKSVMLAIGASILLPGLGEYYAGTFDGPGKYAMTAEGAIWLTYASFRAHGTWVRNDAKAFAAANAGARFDGKDDQFAVNVGNFLTTAEYNEVRAQLRETDLLYTDPSFQWRWESDEARQRFKDQRIRGDRIFEVSKFVVAAAVVNRIVSAFSAGKAVGAHNRAVRASFSFDLHYVPEVGLPRSEGMILTLGTRF